VFYVTVEATKLLIHTRSQPDNTQDSLPLGIGLVIALQQENRDNLNPLLDD
jgi:hypothetical protein